MMNIVFLNTFERKQESEGTITSQLSIGEAHGVWQLVWSEPYHGKMEQSVWYSGTSWEELLTTFRHGVAVKLGEGYAPIIDGMISDAEHSGRLVRSQLLACYSDLYPNESLYAMLSQWRRSRATADKKAPYFIATNRMLRLISVYVPQTMEELLQLPGFGENKVNLYGEEIVSLLQDTERTTVFPLDWVKEQVTREEYAQWLYKQKEQKYKQEMDRLAEQKRLLEGIQQGCSITDLEQYCSMSRRNILIALESLDREGYDIERLIEEELQQVPLEEQAAIWSAIERDGYRYLKPILLEVYGDTGLQGEQAAMYYERIRLVRIRYRRQREIDNQQRQAG
ncbi:HRDC domain-containing protein [Paenibacillus terrigena]|uniref:HRDC domain-containing protein n=1 Tax=Paenibacillus terrigena TaxID=369333 RepID=UPI000A03B3A7|nr:HRDC domain-containing protein [Paenibacillus terrigena]